MFTGSNSPGKLNNKSETKVGFYKTETETRLWLSLTIKLLSVCGPRDARPGQNKARVIPSNILIAFWVFSSLYSET